MKKSKVIVALMLAAMMVFSAVALTACVNPKGGETELIMWGPSGAQTFLKTYANKWAEGYTDSKGNKYTVKLGVMGEGDAATSVLNAPEDAADVFAFADDQVSKLVKGGALSAVGDPTVAGSAAERISKANNEGSVNGAMYNNKLYAYPMSSDNGYFLYYNSSVLTADDISTWDKLFAKAATLNKKVQMDVGQAWYQAAFFFSFGGQANTTASNFGTDDVGLKALKSIYNFTKHSSFIQVDPNDLTGNLNDVTYVAGVAGSWIYKDLTNQDIKLAVLPSLTLDDETVPMKSFLSSKLVGVNGTSKYQEAAHALADYITGEEVQRARVTALETGPSNIAVSNSDEAKALPTVQVLAQQALNSVPQVDLPAGFWDALVPACNAVNATGETAANYINADGTFKEAELRTILTNMITAFNLVSAA